MIVQCVLCFRNMFFLFVLFLERPDQGPFMQHIYTFCYGFAYYNYVCNNVRCIVPDK